jgi:hypothetical protein
VSDLFRKCTVVIVGFIDGQCIIRKALSFVRSGRFRGNDPQGLRLVGCLYRCMHNRAYVQLQYLHDHGHIIMGIKNGHSFTLENSSNA